MNTHLDCWPEVFEWGNKLPPHAEKIDTDSIAQVVSWCRAFSGNERLSNDVSLPLERCVVGSYQIGYLWDYKLNCKDLYQLDKYMSEGIASILIHIIASYEMTSRLTLNHVLFKTWNCWVHDKKLFGPYDFNDIMLDISKYTFQYQRWMLYNHMKRTKRWNEEEFRKSYFGIIDSCIRLAAIGDNNLGYGFALAMSKIQDGEIKRH